MLNKKTKILISAVLVTGVYLFFNYTIVLAANLTAEPNVKFTPQITIPGGPFTAGITSTVSTGDMIGTYIASLYRYGAIFATILAMFMLVLAGWKWLMAAGNSERINSAKDTINGALVGLALLFGGYLLMSQISTKLVEFDSLNLAVPHLKGLPETCVQAENIDICKAVDYCAWSPEGGCYFEGKCGLTPEEIASNPSAKPNIKDEGEIVCCAFDSIWSTEYSNYKYAIFSEISRDPNTGELNANSCGSLCGTQMVQRPLVECVAKLGGGICPAESQVANIITSSRLVITASDPRLMPEANYALQRAINSLQSGESITVTSAYRSWALQQALYECYINKVGNLCPTGCTSCNEAAKPDCDAPHQTGLAVDVCYIGNGVNTCTNEIMTSTYNCIGSTNPPCTAAISQAQSRLRDIMINAGLKAIVASGGIFKCR